MVSTHKILAIDDSIIALKQLQNILERKYEFKGVTSGLSALKYLEETEVPVDMVLLDLEMPVMDGFATLAAIRQKENFKQLPIIILTGNSHKPKVIQGITSGAVGYIVKPADAEQLIGKIEAYFEKKRREAEEAEAEESEAEAESEENGEENGEDGPFPEANVQISGDSDGEEDLPPSENDFLAEEEAPLQTEDGEEQLDDFFALEEFGSNVKS